MVHDAVMAATASRRTVDPLGGVSTLRLFACDELPPSAVLALVNAGAVTVRSPLTPSRAALLYGFWRSGLLDPPRPVDMDLVLASLDPIHARAVLADPLSPTQLASAASALDTASGPEALSAAELLGLLEASDQLAAPHLVGAGYQVDVPPSWYRTSQPDVVTLALLTLDSDWDRVRSALTSLAWVSRVLHVSPFIDALLAHPAAFECALDGSLAVVALQRFPRSLAVAIPSDVDLWLAVWRHVWRVHRVDPKPWPLPFASQVATHPLVTEEMFSEVAASLPQADLDWLDTSPLLELQRRPSASRMSRDELRMVRLFVAARPFHSWATRRLASLLPPVPPAPDPFARLLAAELNRVCGSDESAWMRFASLLALHPHLSPLDAASVLFGL